MKSPKYDPDYDDVKGDISSLLEKIKARISNGRDSTLEKEGNVC